MRLDLRAPVVLVLAGLSSQCTFYSCPDTHKCGPDNTTSNGGSSSTGGSNGSGGAINGNPTGEWVNVTSNLAGMDTMCGNTGLIVAKPDEDRLLAGVSLHGLYSSVDGGQHWKQIKASKTFTASASALIFDPQDSGTYWVVGNHASPYLVATADDGASFTTPGDGAYLGLDYLSLDFTDPQRNLLLVGFHESPRSVSLSRDAGMTWKSVGAKLPATAYCGTPVVIDSRTFLVGCSDGEIQMTTDAGKSWRQASPKGSNRAPLQASDGSIYWPCNDGSLLRITEGGTVWTEVLGAGTLGTPIPPVELPDGRVVAYNMNGLIAGKAEGDWTRLTPPLPVEPYTFTYSPQELSFFYAHGDCTMVVPSDAVMSYAFDYNKN